jgi:hypothetical protein
MKITEDVRKSMIFHPVMTIDEVLALALQPISTDVLRPAKKSQRSAGPAAPPRM